MIVAAHEALAHIQDDDLILIDGERGEVVVHPTAQDIARYRALAARRRAARQAPRASARRRHAHARRRARSTCTRTPSCRPTSPRRAHAAPPASVSIRTEFLFLQRKEMPGEEEQFLAYRDLVLGMGGLPVTIRTLDLGADKADATGLVLDDEDNPALGVRGVRLSLRRPQLLIMQLRAILRASSYGPVRVLVPMVASAEEMASVRYLLERVRARSAHGRPRDRRAHRARRDDRSAGRRDRAARHDQEARLHRDRHQRSGPVHARGRSQQRSARESLRSAASGRADAARADDRDGAHAPAATSRCAAKWPATCATPASCSRLG